MFALQLLPSSAAPVVFLLTDGVITPPDSGTYDNLLMVLNREEVTCSVVQVCPFQLQQRKGREAVTWRNLTDYERPQFL